MDLVGADPRGGPQVLADVTVADTLREGSIPEAAVERGRAAREAAQAKAVKYGGHPADDTFIPLAIETFGCGYFATSVRESRLASSVVRLGQFTIERPVRLRGRKDLELQ
jgi:hypothetical protein